MLAFLSDLSSAAFFETWVALDVAVMFSAGACALGLLIVPPGAARPALRALAGFPLFFVFGGALGIVAYLLGGTASQGLATVFVFAIGAIVVSGRRFARPLLSLRREPVAARLPRRDGQGSRLVREVALLGGLLLAGALIAFFGWGETRDGTIRAMSGAWGDGALHTLIAEAFRIRGGGDLTMPAFVGEQLREPFGYDFVAAMLRSAGFTVGGAFTLPAAGLLACLLGWVGHLSAALASQRPLLSLRREQGSSARSAHVAGRRFAALIAGMLVLSFGGFQWAVMAEHTSAWSLERFFGVHQPAWDKVEDLGLVWANHVNTYVSQKHLLLAAAFLVVLAAVLVQKARKARGAGEPGPTPSFPRLLLFAVATGLLPLFHMHAFIAAALLWGAAALVSRSRRLLGLGVLALVIASPTILWLSGLAGREGFLAFMPGWLSAGGLLGWIWFWALNLGAFLPLVALAARRTFRRDRASALLLTLPALALFLLANLVRFQPYAWDNYKFLHLAWIFVLPLVAAEMARWRFRGARTAVVLLVLFMSLTTLSELSTHARFRAAHPVYTPAHRAAARALVEALPPDAVVLAPTDTVHNHPLTLTGRTLVSGYGGWVWTRHYDWKGRARLLAALREGDPARQCMLARQFGITHVVEGADAARSAARAC